MKKNIDLDCLMNVMNLFFNETGYIVKVVEKEMVQDETLVEGDTEVMNVWKVILKLTISKILYPAIYIKEGENPFIMTSKQLCETYSHVNYLDFNNDGKMSKNFLLVHG